MPADLQNITWDEIGFAAFAVVVLALHAMWWAKRGRR